MFKINFKNKIFFWVYRIVFIIFGVFIFIFGGYDDSPGAQLIGFIIVLFNIIKIIKHKRKTKNNN